jgi:rubrerythrin
MTIPELAGALAVLRHAIHNEIAGQRFYNDASFYCIDPWAKDLFSSVAREEEKHTQLLLVQYKALETRGQWVHPEIALDAAPEVDISSFTFSDDEPAVELFPPQRSAGDAVDRRADDLAALAFSVRMEKEAIDLYNGERARAQEPAAQEAYGFLIEEETRHYRQFMNQWERLSGRPFPGRRSGDSPLKSLSE